MSGRAGHGDMTYDRAAEPPGNRHSPRSDGVVANTVARRFAPPRSADGAANLSLYSRRPAMYDRHQ